MKRFFRLACMAIVVIAASVAVASCSKSDSDESFSPSALGLVYGFSENIFDNYDLALTYTDADGKTVSETLKKDNGEIQQATLSNGTSCSYYLLSKAITFNKGLVSGKVKITATKKSGKSFVDTDKYDLYILYGYGTVKAGTTKVTLESVKSNSFGNAKMLGSKVEEYVSKRIGLFDWSYNVSSNGSISVSSNSSSTIIE